MAVSSVAMRQASKPIQSKVQPPFFRAASTWGRVMEAALVKPVLCFSS